MSHAFQHSTPSTGTPPSFPVPRYHTHCHDLLPHQGDTSAELPPPTGYEPIGIVDDQVNMHFTEDDQITELEGRVESLSYNHSFLPSTYDSAESIATPPEADFDDEQLRALLASPLHLQVRGASAERSQVYHSERESLMSSSSQDPTTGGTGETCRSVFKQRSDQETVSARVRRIKTHFPIGTNVPWNINRFLGVMNRFSDSLTRQMLRNLFLMETETTCLLKRDLNLCSMNIKWDLSTLVVSMSFSSKLMLTDWKLEDAHQGYVETRRERVRLQEELVMKEKGLRDTQIRNMHEVGDMKRAQELRVDQFSVQKLGESHDTIQRLTSQIQDLQERMNCKSDSGEFQEVESNFCGREGELYELF